MVSLRLILTISTLESSKKLELLFCKNLIFYCILLGVCKWEN